MSTSLYTPARNIGKQSIAPKSGESAGPATTTDVLPVEHGSGSGVGATAVGRLPKRQQPASPQTGGTAEVAEPHVLSPDGEQDGIGAKRMRVVELPKVEVPKFVQPPVTGAASAVDVEGLRAHTDSAFAATGTRLVNLEGELGKLSRVVVFLRDAVATVDGNLRQHAEAAGRTHDELKEAGEAIQRQGVAVTELQTGVVEIGARVGLLT